jgi:hypothetical protein
MLKNEIKYNTKNVHEVNKHLKIEKNELHRKNILGNGKKLHLLLKPKYSKME